MGSSREAPSLLRTITRRPALVQRDGDALLLFDVLGRQVGMRGVL